MLVEREGSAFTYYSHADYGTTSPGLVPASVLDPWEMLTIDVRGVWGLRVCLGWS
jgi:hypothetical protein